VGNIGEDSNLSLIDVLFARSLSHGKHVLWYSNTSVPDLGGHQDQDFRSYFQEEIENPETATKGFYRGYTIEIDVSVLAINTILQSEFLKEFEEATMVAKQGAENAMGSKSKAGGAGNASN
jgi:DNA polymerase epsilon subunit 1